MKKIVEKIKGWQFLLGLVVAFIGFLWAVFGYVYSFNENIKVIQKSTLRNTIWNDNIPMHDRLESCDSYLKLGYNSETKKFCNKLLERSDVE